jgi:uncharacterized protein (DUF924 family)
MANDGKMNRVDEILDFWFGTPDTLTNGEQYGKSRSIWFKSASAFDREIKYPC